MTEHSRRSAVEISSAGLAGTALEAAAPATGAPQSAQNLFPTTSCAPQLAQASERVVPQFAQKGLPAGVSSLH
jgi:hypothetical protein